MNISNKTVLVVDDVSYIRILIREALRPYHLKITEAIDYEEAKFFTLKKTYDLMIIDNNLPIKKGIDIAREFLEEGRVKKVILISAFIERKLIWRAAEIGIDYVFKKPLVMSEFRAKVLEILEGKSNETTPNKNYVKKLTKPKDNGSNGKFKEGKMHIIKNTENINQKNKEGAVIC